VHALIESAYRGEASRAGWTTEADLVEGARTSVDELRSILEAPGNVFLMAYDASALVACCHLQRRGDSMYFGMFAVDPARQARGTGIVVLSEAERIAREDWGVPRLVMQVIEVRDELIAWYERHGYRRTGETIPFPYDAAMRRGPLVPELRFAVLEKVL
jgi:GNAT superfamily N-acetyltransferase